MVHWAVRHGDYCEVPGSTPSVGVVVCNFFLWGEGIFSHMMRRGDFPRSSVIFKRFLAIKVSNTATNSFRKNYFTFIME